MRLKGVCISICGEGRMVWHASSLPASEQSGRPHGVRRMGGGHL